MDKEILKPVRWIGPTYHAWKAFPSDVQDVFGYALHLAQTGHKADVAKPLKGFKGSSVLEIVGRFDGNTWRGIYTIQFKDVIYVLHAFQKKSRKGISTPLSDISLIRQRLKLAKAHYEAHKT
ncbi:MAG TPA: type II toxin-antitoxin system RelE/ParE family toxin [Gammaproteobacteria bacterium]|nr:type II toxin-antitoxin system RelE/ParE family toxin [Gammaproteobacteria bacterium]